MDPDAFVGLVKQDQVEDLTTLICAYPQLDTLFGSGWLVSTGTTGMGTADVHPLFWELANPLGNRRIAEALLRLKSESPNAARFISDLKSKRTRGELMGAIREVDVYHALRGRGFDVEWKPTRNIGDRRPDLLIKTEKPIYLEILSINDSEATLEEEAVHNALVIGINKLAGNPYFVSSHMRDFLPQERVAEAVAFVEAAIPTIHLKDEDDEAQRMYTIDGRDVIRFEFRRAYEGSLGQWVGGGGPGRSISPSERIKKKILDKIQAFQLPAKQADEHLNGYLIFLESLLDSNYGVMTAVLGQQTLSFPVPTRDLTEPSNPIPGHAPNGVVHHQSWANAIGGGLDFIASTKPNRHGILLGDQSYLMVKQGLEEGAETISTTLFDGPLKRG